MIGVMRRSLGSRWLSLAWSRVNEDEEAAEEDPHKRLTHENAEITGQ